MTGKVIYVCMTIFVTLSAANAFSEQKPVRKVSIKKPSIRNWEIRTAPIALFASWFTVDLSYRATEHFATGPAGVTFNCGGRGGMLAPCWKGTALGWQANYYFDSVASKGPYISGHAYYDSFKAFSHSVLKGHDELQGTRINAMFGYMFQAPVNFVWHLGIGMEVRNYHVTKFDENGAETTKRENGQHPMLEAKLGYQF